ncbi:unnamed protein product [Dibothriocephalus latus]|uniref:Uncharacterized protein n=1 Tax=Dibothriocephalus latus TaxID=60516 RepID=A0A3P7SDL4_DIBLA|nr:unnamed protein product [Dibothriocephalus latus]
MQPMVNACYRTGRKRRPWHHNAGASDPHLGFSEGSQKPHKTSDWPFPGPNQRLGSRATRFYARKILCNRPVICP